MAQRKTPDAGTGPPERPSSLAQLGAALRRRRESLDLTLDKLAAKTGISKPYLSNIETGRAPGPPSEEKLARLASALEWKSPELIAAADWLRTPESVRKAIRKLSATGAPRRPDGAIDLDRAAPQIHNAPRAGALLPVLSVPVINRVAAGSAAEYTDMDYPAGVADAYVAAPDLPDAPVHTAFALRIHGDSMAPDYVQGEIVIVGPGEARDGDDCVVRLGRGDDFATTFKRIFFVRAAAREGTGEAAGDPYAVRLMPLNPAHPERVVALEDISGVYPLLYRLTPARRPGA